MPNANYSVAGTTMRNGSSAAPSANGMPIVVFGSTTYSDAMTTTSVRIECKLGTSTEDPLAVFVTVHSS
jgi:hypothetical protein